MYYNVLLITRSLLQDNKRVQHYAFYRGTRIYLQLSMTPTIINYDNSDPPIPKVVHFSLENLTSEDQTTCTNCSNPEEHIDAVKYSQHKETK